MSDFKGTPGPWYADRNCNIWRRPPSDLYENGGSVAGDRPLATAHKGWYASNETGFPVEANARLIAAAPDLLEACRRFVEEYGLRCGPEDELASADGQDPIVAAAMRAIAKATGEQP